MLSLLISNPTQAVEDKRKLEKRSGGKKLIGTSMGCPIPDLRRRTSVAKTHTTWNSNVDRGLYYGNNNWNILGNDVVKSCRYYSTSSTSLYQKYRAS